MANTKRYWTGLDDLHQTEAFQTLQGQEFPQHETVDEMLGNEELTSSTTGRRDFLKFMASFLSFFGMEPKSAPAKPKASSRLAPRTA